MNVSCQKNVGQSLKNEIFRCRPVHPSGQLSRWSSPRWTTIAEPRSDLKCDNSVEPLISPSFLIGRRFNTRGWLTSPLPNTVLCWLEDDKTEQQQDLAALINWSASCQGGFRCKYFLNAFDFSPLCRFKSWMINWSTRPRGVRCKYFPKRGLAPWRWPLVGFLPCLLLDEADKALVSPLNKYFLPLPIWAICPSLVPVPIFKWPLTSYCLASILTKVYKRHPKISIIFTYITQASPETTPDPKTQNKPMQFALWLPPLILINVSKLKISLIPWVQIWAKYNFFHKIYTVCFWYLKYGLVKFVWGGHKRDVSGTVWGLYRVRGV